MHSFFSRIFFALITGYILAFYSEWSFWAGRPSSATFFLEAIPSWLLYSWATYFFLAAASYFRVQSFWALFLAGALYGWLVEGLFVQTMYDDFPINLSWTGLAWHSLISVCFGLGYLPRKLREGKAVFACSLAGITLGFWSIGWWLEPEVQIMMAEIGDGLLPNVWLYNSFFALLLIPAYWLFLRFDRADFQPNRIEFGLIAALTLAYYAFITIATQPLALIILPLALALALFGLWKNRQSSPPLETSASKIHFLQLWPLLLIPILSSLLYSAALIFGISLPTLPIVLVITTPAGFILFSIALWKLTGISRRKA